MSKQQPMKILLGGVPFGRDNVGDEAILECMVRLVRDINPTAEITVSTHDREATAEKLKVCTCPLYGFNRPGYDPEQMRRTLATQDVFVWAGATGLSDYPEAALRVLESALDLKKQTVIFGTGMNRRLNPSWYTLTPSFKRDLLVALSRCTLNQIDFVRLLQTRKENKARRQIARLVQQVDLVVTRDAESKEELVKTGCDRPIQVGADPAILLEPADIAEYPFPADVRRALESQRPKMGLCLSAQQPLRELNRMIGCLDELIATDGLQLVGIPMNPETDAQVLEQVKRSLRDPERLAVASGRHEPGVIAGLAGRMDLVMTSRLHLLILASISSIPLIGINRGSKIENFLRAYGLRPVGDTDQIDFDQLKAEIRRLLDDAPRFRADAQEVRRRMLDRLTEARQSLLRSLNRQSPSQSASTTFLQSSCP